jgi:hypothetical protein
MAQIVTLVHPRGSVQVSYHALVKKSALFANDHTLHHSPYVLTSQVSLSDFQTFVLALQDTSVPITNTNFRGLSLLSREFRFTALSSLLSQFRGSSSFDQEEVLLSALEERQQQHNADVESLLCRVGLLEASEMQSRILALEERIDRHDRMIANLRRTGGSRNSAKDVRDSAKETNLEAVHRNVIARLGIGSETLIREQLLVSEFPEIFGEFRGRRFSLSWRGTRDSFDAGAFHCRYDVQSDSVTLILDTKGNIFGGFTPAKCGLEEADPERKSFLFTLVNPHNVPARIFEMNAESRKFAVNCERNQGPCFGDPCTGDIIVSDNCNANENSFTCLGSVYTNDTGLDGTTFFTGSRNFQVREIELFKIAVRLPVGWNSVIIPEFPSIFADFLSHQFSLLWRGSRDGFGANDFHRRCNGHRNTLTVILDTKGNIFGGFTPVEWSEWSSSGLVDEEMKGFLFTLRNPHRIPGRRFALKAEKKDRSVFHWSEYGPAFYDIRVFGNCNTETKCFTYLGTTYTNDTGLDGKTVFTGSLYFQVKEIEVFECIIRPK